MNRRFGVILLLLVVAVVGAGCAGTRGGEFYDEESYDESGYYPARVSYFYDDLAPYGRWYHHAPYGWVWSPSGVPMGWRPYTVGSWAYSDWGWTWMSADPWGWAPYHYGRWSFDPFYGWLWVPDDVWAPAWVSWRYGDGYVGWAPLPPDALWRSGYLDYEGDIDPSRWSFTRERDFVTSRPRTQVLPVTRNRTLIERTRDVTRYTAVDGRPAERGLNVATLEKSTGRSVPRYRLLPKPTGADREVVRGRVLEVPRPIIASDARYRMKASPPPRATRERAVRATRGTGSRAVEERVVEPKKAEPKKPEPSGEERPATVRERVDESRPPARERVSERRERERERLETARERRAREREERESSRLRDRREREEARLRALEERERARRERTGGG